ncbi:MAG: four helix bundle protein [Anaerolineales bacterium]|nr:four helix bundle protein [Anaerolineales bacterium]
MALIKKFEDIIAWLEARNLVASIYGLTSTGALARNYGLRDQIQRAAASAMTNIAEGFDCESKKEFARFLGIARRSAVEVQSLLYAAFDVGYINEQIYNTQYHEAEKTKAIIGGLKHSITPHD